MITRDTIQELPVRIGIAGKSLDGDLSMVPDADGLIIFAHGSGSSRFSPRNRAVASALWNAGFDTLLLDLLTREEESIDVFTGRLRFDIGLLADRVVAAVDYARLEPRTRERPIGLFGASTGAAAALVAAAHVPDYVGAVVSRGGRPDLADGSLARVRAPTLLIVGGDDTEVITMNREALGHLRCEKQLTVVPGATHLFEEAGALETVSTLAAQWFERYLAPRIVRPA